MKHRKVWKLMNCLTDHESGQFCRWLDVELWNKQEFVKKLAGFLTENLDTPPTFAEAWAFLYPELPFDDARLRKLAGDLSHHVEEYLAIRAFRKDRDLRDVLLLRELNQRNQDELFVKIANKKTRELEGRKIQDPTLFQSLYEVESEKQRYLVRNRIKTFPSADAIKSGIFNMQTVNHAFDNWWINLKMELATLNLNQERIFGEKTTSFLLEETLLLAQKHPRLIREPRIVIQRDIYFILKGEPVNIQFLVDLIRNYKDHFAMKELRNYNTLLINYHIRLLNQIQKKEEVGRILLGLFEWAIEDKFILIDNALPPSVYANIVTLCLRIKDTARAWKYLNDLKPLLPEDIREDVYRLRVAAYFFTLKEFQKTIDMLANYKFHYIPDAIAARAYLLEAHYEINTDPEWLVDQTDSLIRFIRKRKNFSNDHKRPYLNRLKIFKRLLRAYTREQLVEIEKTIRETTQIDHPGWLLEKIHERLTSQS